MTRWRLLLAALTAAVAVLFGAGTASATTPAVAETRVGASTPATVVVVGPHECITAGQRWGNAPPAAETVVATVVAANAPARFAVNSAGEATMSLRAGSASLEVSEHAALRMTQRGVSIDAAEKALAQTPFRYFHNDVWKTGYYDPVSRVFLGSVDGRITTVIGRASTNYIDNLKAAVP